MADIRICTIDECGKPVRRAGLCGAHYHRKQRHGDPLGGGASRGYTLWFLREIVLPYDGDDCLIWPFCRGSHGYGQIKQNGRLRYVHRLVCKAIHGPPPTLQHEAAHRCGRGHDACVAPNHVRWATPRENAADKLLHGTHLRGEAAVNTSKLTADDVRQIRALCGSMTQRQLADRFGVGERCISAIHTRQNWAWLDE